VLQFRPEFEKEHIVIPVPHGTFNKVSAAKNTAKSLQPSNTLKRCLLFFARSAYQGCSSKICGKKVGQPLMK
jgi:hypothetical protein